MFAFMHVGAHEKEANISDKVVSSHSEITLTFIHTSKLIPQLYVFQDCFINEF